MNTPESDSAGAPEPNPAGTQTDPSKGRQQPMSQRIVAISLFLGLAILLGVLPFALFSGWTQWHDLVKIAIYGYMIGLFSALIAGRREALELITIFVGFLVLGVIVHPSIFGTALVITAGTVLIPVYGVRGGLKPAIITAMLISNAVSVAILPWPGESSHGLLFYAAIAGFVWLGGLWGTFVGLFVRSRIAKSKEAAASETDEAKPTDEAESPQPKQDPEVQPASVKVAVAGGVPLAVGTFLISYFVGSSFPQYHWAWILAPLFSMMLAKGIGSLKTTRDLMIGSIVGTGLAVLLVQVSMPFMVQLLLGMLVITTSVALSLVGKPYWISASVSTAGVIVLTGAGSNFDVAATSRLLFGFFGAILALVVGVIAVTCIRWARNSEQEPELQDPQTSEG